MEWKESSTDLLDFVQLSFHGILTSSTIMRIVCIEL